MMIEDENPLDFTPLVRPAAWDTVAEAYAEQLADPFARYADDAIALAAVQSGDRVLDVATGPGTLALRAAAITQVHALDFSPSMLATLEARAPASLRPQLWLHVGDGQDLPFGAGSFDAAFSMFGLFLFPDRAQGFRELFRVLRPGGRAVVSSWQAQSDEPVLRVINEELWAEATVPDTPPPAGPLADPEALRQEMGEAGFTVEVVPSVHRLEMPSLNALWTGMERAHVGLALAREQFSAARYEALHNRIEGRLRTEVGDGPQALVMPAWLGFGRKA